MKTISIIVIAAIGALSGVAAVALPAEGNALVQRSRSEVSAGHCPRKGGHGRLMARAPAYDDWSSGRNYFVDDIVMKNGIEYKCKKNHHSVSVNGPGNSDYWFVC